MQVERGDNIVAGHRRRRDALGGFAAILVEGQFVFAMLAVEHGVEGLLKAFAPDRVRPEHFVIIDDTVWSAPRLSGVTDDLPGEFAVRINAQIHRPPRQAFGQTAGLVVLFVAQVLRDLERQHAAVVVMPQDLLAGDIEFVAEQLFSGDDFGARIAEGLRIRKIERRGKRDGQVVNNLVLGQRLAMAIGDLPARGRDIEHVGAGQLLRLVSGLDRFLERGRSGGGRGRRCGNGRRRRSGRGCGFLRRITERLRQARKARSG